MNFCDAINSCAKIDLKKENIMYSNDNGVLRVSNSYDGDLCLVIKC